MAITLRSEESQNKYDKYKNSLNKQFDSFVFNLKDNVIHEYNFWVIIPNDFPYDLIASYHHLLVPKRIFSSEKEMTKEEYMELLSIKEQTTSEYDFLLENLGIRITVFKHYHLHLLKFKKSI